MPVKDRLDGSRKCREAIAMDEKAAIANGFAPAECGCIPELTEAEIERTESIMELLDFHRSSQLCYETLWRWAFRGPNKHKFASIVDVLG